MALDGPCVQSLDLIGPFAVTACSRINDSKFLLQGISVPKEFEINHFLFGRIEANARKIPHRFTKKFKIESTNNRTLSTMANIGNKKNYVFNEAASKDYVCINQGTKLWLFLIISDHSRQFPTTPNYPIPPQTMSNHYLL